MAFRKTKEFEHKSNICKAIIYNQLAIEVNDEVKNTHLYRQNLKNYGNKFIQELEKKIDTYDYSFNEAEEFIIYTQQNVEMIIEFLKDKRIDELNIIGQFLQIYNSDFEKVEKFFDENTCISGN